MYKRALFLIFFAAIIFCKFSFAKADFDVPTGFIDIIVNTTGGDGVFDFRATGSLVGSIVPEHFSITTSNGTGTVEFESPGATYNFYETLPSGFEFVSSSYTLSYNSSSAVGVGDTDAYVALSAHNRVRIIFNSKKKPKTPVLIIPGVLGTDIKKDSDKLWLDLGHNFTDVGDQFMDPLTFDNSLKPTDSTVSTSDVIGKQTVSAFTYDYSDGLIQEFQNQGYTQGTGSKDNLFLFPYDWRYGVSGIISGTGSTTVDSLAQKIQDIMAQTGIDKVDVVAHSTGGLLVKQYVINHPSDNHIGKAVFLGVPNTGAPKAIKTLL